MTAVRTAVLVLLVATLAGACARPGQLGHEDEAAPPAPSGDVVWVVPGTPPVPAAADGGSTTAFGAGPASPAALGSDARGRLDAPVRISAPGPSEFLVRTETLAPGQDTGWISHPGTVISVVRSGTVTVVQRGACEPASVGPEQSFFVEDANVYELRNDGPEPAVLTRSELLAPGAAERNPADPAC